MLFLRLTSAFALTLAVAALSQAQTKVYESTDAEGNTVFSDTPSEGAQSMEIPPTNVATPVEPGPPPTAVSAGKASAAGVDEDLEEHPRIIVNREEEEHREGDRWRTEHTEDGDILSQEPRHGEGEEGTEQAPRHRVERHPVHRGKR